MGLSRLINYCSVDIYMCMLHGDYQCDPPAVLDELLLTARMMKSLVERDRGSRNIASSDPTLM